MEVKIMKKTILVIAATAFIALFSTQAFACYWDGYWGGPAGGPTAGFNGDQHQGFYEKTAQLRQDLAEKRGEYNALMAASNPDPKRAAQLSREIATLHDQLRVQARSYNLPMSNNGYCGHGRMGRHGCW
jgi:zinc resistance-associated protein